MSITAAERQRRFQMIMEGYEADGPDCTTPHAARVEIVNDVLRKHPRWVLVEQYGDHGNYLVNLAEDRASAEAMAAHNVQHGALPTCIFDLDELAGMEPTPCEGDEVKLTKEGEDRYAPNEHKETTWYVVGSETDTFDGVAYEKFHLALDPDAEWGNHNLVVDEQYVDITKAAYSDERMPVRYQLARMMTIVVFNTIPEQP